MAQELANPLQHPGQTCSEQHPACGNCRELLAVVLAPSPALRYVRVSGQMNEVGMEGILEVKRS